MIQIDALAAAVKQHEVNIADIRRRYAECIANLSAAPTDLVLLTESSQLSAELASANAGLEALSHALKDAKEEAERVAAVRQREGARVRAKGFAVKFTNRRKSYAKVQEAGTAFLDALREHLASGKEMRAEALTIDGRDGMYPLADAAAGVAGVDAVALATTLRQAMEVFGTSRLSRYIAVNDAVPAVSFLDAHKTNAERVGNPV